MMDQSVALITGANKGIGFEVARQLGELGFNIVIGSRDPQRGQDAAAKLKSQGIESTMVKLDVTSRADADSAAAAIKEQFGRLDVLVYNAAVVLDNAGVIDADLEKFRHTFETNVFGVVTVTQAMLPLPRQSTAGRIVNVSSGLASLTQNADPQSPFAQVKLAAYNASKAALNMLTVILAYELRDTPIKVNSADPGYTATDLNNHRGTQTVAEGSEAIIRLATLDEKGPTGQFHDRAGRLPW